MKQISQSTETTIYSNLVRGIANQEIIDLLLPNDGPIPYETDIWDYKLGLPKSQVRKPDDVEGIIASLIRDIASFYNSFGGYLILALPDAGSEITTAIMNHDAMIQKIHKYTQTQIYVRYFAAKKLIADTPTSILLIQIPKRPNDLPPCQFKRASPLTASGKRVFEQNNICARKGNECVIANNDPALLQFIVGERPYLFENQITPISISECDHNLPPRDPNVLQFIGRRSYLDRLWQWLAGPRDPIRLLTAIGGSGKTSIAYEFCEQLIQSGQSHFDKIVWMTGKSQTYAAVLGQHVSTTRTDFTNMDSFLGSVLLELAVTDEDLLELPSIQDKEDILHMMVAESKLFLVIDDVDSLDLGQQQELYALVSRIFYQAVGAGSKSKCLLTSRLELYAGANQILRVRGFQEDEAKEYSKIVAKYLELSESQQSMAFAEFPLLYSSSQGSPVFIASILRLFSLGDEFKGTIEHWKGKEGEDVRRSMFQREIKALSYSTARTLFAMQLMAETNFDELKEMLEVDRQGLRTDLGRLRQFHLFVGSDDPATGESLTVPEPIRLMFEITEEVLNADDAKDIKRRAAQKSGHSPHVDPIKTEMRRITQLLNGKKLDDAEVVARSAIKKFPKNGDVCWQLGKIFLHKHPAALEDADKAFNEARQKKCARPELLHYSVYTKFKLNDEEGILRLTSHRIDPPPRGVPNVYRLIVYYRRGRNAEERGDKAEAISEYSTVSKEGARITADGRCDAAFMIVTKLMRASSIYAVNNSVSLYGLGRGSLPTAQLCSEFLALGIWSNYTASVFIKSFVAWWDAVESGFSNDESAVNVAKKLVANTNRSVGKLGFIDDEFDTTGRQVSQLLAHNERMARRIQDYARVRKLS